MTLCPAGPVLRITFGQNLIAFCSRPEETSDVISGIFVGLVVSDDCMKFGDLRINLSRDITPEAVLGGIFDSFFAVTSDRK